MVIIETQRLILRTWQSKDLMKYFRINQDPKVLEFLGDPPSLEKIKTFIGSANKQFDAIGYSLWATEEKSSGKLIGSIGLNHLKWNPPFKPNIEISWKISSEFWGKGYATEGATAVLKYGFEKCKLQEVVSFTNPQNIRSIRVMEKIGMKRDPSGDFYRSELPKDHPLSFHILFRIKK